MQKKQELYYEEYHKRKSRKRLNKRNLLIGFFILIAVFVISLFLMKDSIFEYYFNKSIEHIANKYELQISYSNYKLDGFNKININNLKITTCKGKYNFLEVSQINLKIDLLSIFLLKPQVKHFVSDNLSINIIKTSTESNIDFLFDTKSISDSSINDMGNKSYAVIANKVVKSFFYNAPRYVLFNNARIDLTNDSLHTIFYSREFSLTDNIINADLNIETEHSKASLSFAGEIIHNIDRIALKIYYNDSSDLSNRVIPYISEKYKFNIAFDTLNLTFNKKGFENELLLLGTSMTFNNLKVFNRRISLDNVFVNKIDVNLDLKISNNAIEIDSSSSIILNKLSFNPYFCYQKYPKEKITYIINKPFFNSMDLFNSLPEGLFPNIRGIETSGKIAYRLFFEYEKDRVDSLKFSSDVFTKGFKIEKLGKSNLDKMNKDFIHFVYENDNLLREIDVSKKNAHYVELDNISPYLINSVFTSEDGLFLWHRGFNEESFRNAIIQNIKEKRFARGASTITMQLVKNVFLNRNKTVVRKLEEVLIVWLIETNRITSKKRMLEVYLNVIEWGPNVYGIGEASEYYFNKQARDIDLKEAIFLSCILPNPKNFKYYFDKNGFLKPFMIEHYKFVSKKMLAKEYITQKDFEELLPIINIKGKAKEKLDITLNNSNLE